MHEEEKMFIEGDCIEKLDDKKSDAYNKHK